MNQKNIKKMAMGFALSACLAATAAIAEDTEKLPRYPTAVLADYVLACMSANGNTYDTLQKCSCSIDFISERLNYTDYEKINTVMSVRLDRGQRGVFFRDSSWAKNMIEKLENLQAESTLRCF